MTNKTGLLSPWQRLLEHPPVGGHFVQFYKADESSLAKNVCHYILEGLRQGDGALLIATRAHRDLFSEFLAQSDADLNGLLARRQLVFLDAQEKLYSFMTGGLPDWIPFERAIGTAVREVSPATRSGTLRTYGEMVGLLWNNSQFDAAIRLEQFWNRLLARSSFSLYCSYAIDLFGEENLDVLNVDGALCTHTHMVPAEPDGFLEAALNLALEETTVADRLRGLLKSHRNSALPVMPAAEAMVLALRRHFPEYAGQIILRTQHHYARTLAEIKLRGAA
ncbi:MAG TPA: MEDS domain-containing protein [Bryobacteraceae bacterium]|nr:MEDS domain-containing protein [Bryobacteraceae bacterium]